MKAVIIAGGLGTRLRPLTYSLPKPIVPLVNVPFVIHQIEHLIRHGIDEVILNLHYLSHEIKKILEDGRKWGIKINYSIEEHPLGTAGAVKNAEQYFGSDPLLVFNGDVLTDLNISKLVAFHRQKKAVVTLALTEVEDPTPFGLVLTNKEGKVTEFIEKPSWERVTAKTINAGTYVLDPRIFKDVPPGQPYSFERQLYPDLLAAGTPIFGYASDAYWIDIGNPEKYLEAHAAILRGEVAVKIRGARVGGKTWLGEKAQVDESVKLLGASVLGDHVKLGRQVEIRDYVVLGEKVSVGEHTILDRTIVWSGVKIGKHVHLSGCILGYDCVVEDDVVINGKVVFADGSIIKKGTRIFT